MNPVQVPDLHINKIRIDIELLLRSINNTTVAQIHSEEHTKEILKCWTLYNDILVRLKALDEDLFSELCELQIPTPRDTSTGAYKSQIIAIEPIDKLRNDLTRAKEYFGIYLKTLNNNTNNDADPLRILTMISGRFHRVARQLRTRYGGRPTLEIDDEYDVQYLLHAMLAVFFDDIRPEEWTPSYAGKSSRMDFLLKQEEIVVETKRTRVGLGPKELGDELIIDIRRYNEHPNCKRLYCFVYDPDGRIANPAGIETDLTGSKGDLEVIVRIEPK